LVTEPKLILADEPTGALDINTGQEIMNLLIDLNKHENTTIILVTHDMNIAKQCHRVITLQDGKIL
jgi:putative ABC transport system ATP-binding protein